MALSCGIIGLPNAGKSTLFNAISGLQVDAHPFPFCTIEPNTAIVRVPDERLDTLAKILKPEKVTYATIEFYDCAGLVKDAHRGEGLGNKFLSQIRGVDAIAHVVRLFKEGTVSHVYGNLDPKRDLEIVETELMISDLEILEERVKKLERLSKMKEEGARKELEALIKLKSFLQSFRFPDPDSFSEDEKKSISSYSFLSLKPFIYIANVDEEQLSKTPFPEIEEYARSRNARVVYVCARLEEELSLLDPKERRSYMETFGIEELATLKIIRSVYDILGLITFYTVVGKEIRAWPVKKGTKCVEAAGKIHSDMEKGFIRAEVISFSDFLAAGSEKEAREKGLIHIEGKDYLVRDGDILHIRFHV